jgi:hypothetical protein
LFSLLSPRLISTKHSKYAQFVVAANFSKKVSDISALPVPRIHELLTS